MEDTLLSTDHVFCLKVGDRYYGDPVSTDGSQVLRVFQSNGAASRYKEAVEPFMGSALQIHELSYEELYKDLATSTELRGCSVILSYCDYYHVVSDTELLRDPTATIH